MSQYIFRVSRISNSHDTFLSSPIEDTTLEAAKAQLLSKYTPERWTITFVSGVPTMTKTEVKAIAYQALALLEKAQVGSAPAAERAAFRKEANALLSTLTSRWWRVLPQADQDYIVKTLNRLA